ncbi:MAG: T9SS type A sorting domain-containing protein [Saprospiraceae bacterium]|nr:T9SS type A sorting domain-containing protein [Saprospiraceae bacterium]MBK7811710.1 T9SS type A sorting domain-containing protein [Saprospiraceae bacterium]MBK9631569.1 T9SS type A sorting domain-containing protein [Saprospiraceae bacterium]
MKHLKKIVVLALFVIFYIALKPENVFAQSITRQCISSNTSLSQIDGTYFSASIGQVYSCQTNNQPSNHAMQGFQQPMQLRITPLNNKEKSNFSFQISPNPSSGIIQIDANQKIAYSQIKILDTNGKIFLDQKSQEWSQQTINLQNYLDGEYLIQLSDHLQFTKTYKLLIFK